MAAEKGHVQRRADVFFLFLFAGLSQALGLVLWEPLALLLAAAAA